MATRFVATKECEVHDNIKQELIRRQENETTLICKSIGLQGRAIKNKIVEEVLALEAKGGGLEELIPLISGQRGKRCMGIGQCRRRAHDDGTISRTGKGYSHL